MSQYLIINRIQVQNANTISGLTWGFPSITNFLGFTHALNRKISDKYQGTYHTELSGCAVIAHEANTKVYRSKQFAPFEFIQSKNPPVLAKHKKSSPPIIEEGKMNLCVSLVIKLKTTLELTTDLTKKFKEEIRTYCSNMRLAGGSITKINNIYLFSGDTKKQNEDLLKKLKRITMPGFVLLDRKDYLKEHHEHLIHQHESGQLTTKKPELIDAWLDFSAMKYKSIPIQDDTEKEITEETAANWEYVPKPKPGYLVPIMTGYKAISELYPAGQVANTRDETTPTCFVEAIHSIGEWKGIHGINSIEDTLWHYKTEGQWYLCEQAANEHDANTNNQSNELNELLKLLS